MVEKIVQAMLKLASTDAEGKAVLGSLSPKFTGCEPAKSDDYNSIRETIKTVFGDEYYKAEK
jgi:ABC-type phosphate/phosphonate transport system substrate-binding protein